MIIGDVIYFGYGDVAVGHSLDKCLLLRQFEPPAEVGSHLEIDGVNWLSKLIRLNITREDLVAIKLISEDKNKLHIDGYELNFSHYNKKSVEVVKEHIGLALQPCQQALAC